MTIKMSLLDLPCKYCSVIDSMRSPSVLIRQLLPPIIQVKYAFSKI
ncbi:hypothetical protein LC605_14435 [Nostoc sp. CHAB 5836]|nr:hypothetical protein [Nostoc sp. CHAB 5836]